MKKLTFMFLGVFLVSCGTASESKNISAIEGEVDIQAVIGDQNIEDIVELDHLVEEEVIVINDENTDGDMFPLLAYKNNLDIEIVDCSFANGDDTQCYKVTTIGTPDDHALGPWCPSTISDSAEDGGIWMKDGEIYDVDGKFIESLPELYGDQKWLLHDEAGNVFKTESREDCVALAGARLIDDFTNYCIECLPEYVEDIEKVHLIPIEPVKNATIATGGRGGRPQSRGLALNGAVFDAPAPMQIILSGYTIPALDDAGGHINMDAGYHYHAATGKTQSIKQSDGHADLIGVAMDGYFMYSQLGENGEAADDLDNCRGHSDDTRGYHYHVDAAGSNNFIDCFSGVLAN